MTTPKRRGVETVESTGGGIEQADNAAAPAEDGYSIERGPASSPEGSIESVNEERSAGPYADERSNIERP